MVDMVDRVDRVVRDAMEEDQKLIATCKSNMQEQHARDGINLTYPPIYKL